MKKTKFEEFLHRSHLTLLANEFSVKWHDDPLQIGASLAAVDRQVFYCAMIVLDAYIRTQYQWVAHK